MKKDKSRYDTSGLIGAGCGDAKRISVRMMVGMDRDYAPMERIFSGVIDRTQRIRGR